MTNRLGQVQLLPAHLRRMQPADQAQHAIPSVLSALARRRGRERVPGGHRTGDDRFQVGAGADHLIDSRRADLAAEVLRLTGGAGADLVLESAGGATLDASLAAAKRVTGRVVVYGLAGGQATITNRDLVYRHQIHVIGLNIGILIRAAPQIFGELMGEMSGLIAAGVLSPGQPTTYELADGPRALAELEARATVGKLALLP